MDDDAAPGGNGSQDFPYQTIQEGVDGAEPGDTVFVHKGSYSEEVLVDKELELEGEGRGTTSLSYDGGTALTVDAGGFKLLSLRVHGSRTAIRFSSGVEDARVEDVNISDNEVGIRFQGNRWVNLSNSDLSLNREAVLATGGARDIIFQRCVITQNSVLAVNASDNLDEELILHYCFWGDVTGPTDLENNKAGKGDNISGPVVFRPWYEEEGMDNFRFVNPGEEEDSSAPAVLYILLLIVIILLLLGFTMWLDDSYFEAAYRWFIVTFEIEDMTEDQRFWVSMGLYAILLIFLVLVADLAAISIYENSDSLAPLQRVETVIVAEFQQRVMGIELTYNDTVIYYNEDQEWQGHSLEPHEKIGGVAFEVSATCSGFHETVFLCVLILGFKGVSWKVKTKWAGIMAVVVFVENIIRIIILFPYYLVYGKAAGEQLHHDWWHTYQYIFIMLLFMLWFLFVGLKDIDRQLDETASGKANGPRSGPWTVTPEAKPKADKAAAEEVQPSGWTKESAEKAAKEKEAADGKKEDEEEGQKEEEIAAVVVAETGPVEDGSDSSGTDSGNLVKEKKDLE